MSAKKKPTTTDTCCDAKPPTKKKAKDPSEKQLTLLDAAVKVLGVAGEPMTCLEMIEAISKAKLWSSPNGRTPAATLYSAILRSIEQQGKLSPFTKTGPGKFGLAKK
jgi:hypothetical protein